MSNITPNECPYCGCKKLNPSKIYAKGTEFEWTRYECRTRIREDGRIDNSVLCDLLAIRKAAQNIIDAAGDLIPDCGGDFCVLLDANSDHACSHVSTCRWLRTLDNAVTMLKKEITDDRSKVS